MEYEYEYKYVENNKIIAVMHYTLFEVVVQKVVQFLYKYFMHSFNKY